MGKILCIDTATDICTVSLIEEGRLISNIDSGEDRTHATQLAVYIDKLLKNTGNKVSDLDAVAVSKGPGSYTGLRIGVSMAKGLCYGAKKPLISVSTLEAMCYGIPDNYLKENNLANFYFAPMLDARRMEVYTAVFDTDIAPEKEVHAEIINENSFKKELEQKNVLFFGTGIEKTIDFLNSDNAHFYKNYIHSSKYMTKPASLKFNNKQFEDVAYFEPFYLKDFMTTKPKKNILFPNSRK